VSKDKNKKTKEDETSISISLLIFCFLCKATRKAGRRADIDLFIKMKFFRRGGKYSSDRAEGSILFLLRAV